MDPAVLRAMARWPQVPAVYGWLALDRRGNWLLRQSAEGAFGPVGNAALRAFIARNYAVDTRGCWYFQNGPQRVYVTLAYTPLVLRYVGESLVDQCDGPVAPRETFVDEEGSVLLRGARGIGLLDDRDLGIFESRLRADWQSLPRVVRAEVPGRFGFVAAPSESLR
ncbi:MAG TPA: DUF2946 family protein [Burkholderiales bacterium]|nr:DUF2946 family protein [Burkholderiales bacterium]